jgi:Tfp pilus assembly protein PilO
MRRQGLLAFVFIGALALALVGGWYAFAYRPVADRIATTKARIAQDTTAVSTEQAELASLMRDKRHAGVLRRELASLEQALPQQFSLAAFITMADREAASAGVPLLQISPSQPGSERKKKK